MKQLDHHLAVDEVRGTIVCRRCDAELCDADENYKLHALCERKPLAEAGPLVNDPAEYVDEDVEFRQFYCPGCGTLLENEVILAELEPVHDKQLHVEPTDEDRSVAREHADGGIVESVGSDGVHHGDHRVRELESIVEDQAERIQRLERRLNDLSSRAMNVEEWRAEFPAIADEGRVHLNNCSASPIPRRGLEARRECERVWIEEGNPWATWLEKVNETKARFADLINADEDEIAIVSCATQAFAQVASALTYDERNEIVTTDLEFPTLPQFWHAQRKRGAEVRFAESPDGVRVPAETYAEAMSEDTLMVCSAHAYSFTGGLMDVEAVADAVHDRGGYLFLDAYQSVGIVPIDVKEQNIDMLTAGTLKFLLGGPGIAFLYVDREVANDLEPANMGWFSTDDVFGFETREPQFADGARRFELGTPPAPNAYTACAGMEVIQEFGVENVRDRVVEHTRDLIEGLETRGFVVRTPHVDAHRGGVVNVQVEDPQGAADALIERGFNVSTRAGGVRLSPHFYTTTEEVEQAVEAVAEVATPRRTGW